MITKVTYEQNPLIGLIRMIGIKNGIPALYSLKLFHRTNGIIQTKKEKFALIDDAISHASLYGFSMQNWVKVDE